MSGKTEAQMKDLERRKAEAGTYLECEHDYANAKRVSRATFLCPRCGKDITYACILLAEVGL